MSSTTLTRILPASLSAVFAALTDPRDVMCWMVPDGMTGHVHEFDPREGGRFRITLRYDEPTVTGKTASNTDTYHGTFIRVVPERLVEQELEFETEDPSMQGVMRIVFELEGSRSGTRLTARHEGLPPGLSPSDNEIGWSMSLAKLEKLLAGRDRP